MGYGFCYFWVSYGKPRNQAKSIGYAWHGLCSLGAARLKVRYSVQIDIPCTACSEPEIRRFITALSHIPVDMQRETLGDITDQIFSALTEIDKTVTR